jgi:hypothetical protein
MHPLWAKVRSKLRDALSLERSAEDVATNLTAFIEGTDEVFRADDFMSITIRDRALDAIREDFIGLTGTIEGWHPEQPFPAEKLAELRALIARAEAKKNRI